MAWTIRFQDEAKRELKKLDPNTAKRITRFIRERIATLEDPRSLGEALHGPELGKYWKYRTGDFRIICKILDTEITVVVIRIGNRKEIYR